MDKEEEKNQEMFTFYTPFIQTIDKNHLHIFPLGAIAPNTTFYLECLLAEMILFKMLEN